MHRATSKLRWAPILGAVLAIGLSSAAWAVKIELERPGDREFVRDQADMLLPADEQKIQQLCDTLLTEKQIPIIVVTIESMAAHGGADMRMETFARLLFDQWEIGYPEWNVGILLLVSKGDRKARIELGAQWDRSYDLTCQEIMDTLVIPPFKKGEFSAGIVAGADALDKMSRQLELPTPPVPTWVYVAMAVGAFLLVFTIVSLIRRGSGGWAWVFWGALFALLGFLLYNMLRNSGRSGGFSGGSFGGGFSGGGGATGSW